MVGLVVEGVAGGFEGVDEEWGREGWWNVF